jgi:FKBP-type peptidyl-prolyl cis-trans isomerase (trigger factor)
MDFKQLADSFAVKKLPQSEVELTGEVPAADIAPYRDQALAHLGEHIELPGFRPGKVPQDMILKKVGEMGVLEEALDIFIKDFYPALVEQKQLEVVGRPEVRVTKMAPGNPAALSIVVAVYPAVTLPKRWKETGASVIEEAAVPATDEEVEKTLEDLRQSRKKDGVVPELDDAFAKSLGAFENFAALKEQIRKGITEEKARQPRDARRGKIIDALLKNVEVEVPNVFVESELEKIMSQMREDIGRMGMKFEDYLKRAGKTDEAIRNDFRDQAAKRAKLQLTLNKIVQEEKLEADPTAIEQELKHAMEHFPEANPELVKIHIETVLRNELALKLLEGEVK